LFLTRRRKTEVVLPLARVIGVASAWALSPLPSWDVCAGQGPLWSRWARGTRTHNPRIKSPQLPAASTPTRLQLPHEPPSSAGFLIGCHEFASRTVSRGGGNPSALGTFVGQGAPSGSHRTPPQIRSGLDQASCSLTSCSCSSVTDRRLVLMIRTAPQRRLGPTISADTRCAVRFSPGSSAVACLPALVDQHGDLGDLLTRRE
jgi:hypothetical protein